jgi:hypothetical protein
VREGHVVQNGILFFFLSPFFFCQATEAFFLPAFSFSSAPQSHDRNVHTSSHTE